MNILTLALITSALAGAGPTAGNARPANAGDGSATPVTVPAASDDPGANEGVGGPDDDDAMLTPPLDGPAAAPMIVVEGFRRDSESSVWSIAPDPALTRRYAPHESRPLNRIVVEF